MDKTLNDSIQKDALGTLALKWENKQLALLDQRVLPHQIIWKNYSSVEAVFHAIRDMVVRGAPAIGISAAYGAVFAVEEVTKQLSLSETEVIGQHAPEWKKEYDKALAYLATSRPTAVNLFWAIDRVRTLMDSLDIHRLTPRMLLNKVTDLAELIHQEDIQSNLTMGKLGADWIVNNLAEEQRVSVMTHCNAGALATGGYGTALGVIRSLAKLDRLDNVFADETRPWFQGARLTVWELMQDNIPVSLNTEGAAAHLMKTENISWIIVGADRITANGDAANKIGTYGLAVLAKYQGIKVMVVAPSSTIDMSLASGNEIPIEERGAEELTHCQGKPIAADQVPVKNPVFDVTPAELIDVIVTEKGCVAKPDTAKMQALMK